MPIYTFEKNGRTTEERVPIAEAEDLTLRMRLKGWQKVYPRFGIINIPTYSEAVEESQGLYDLAARGEGPMVGR